MIIAAAAALQNQTTATRANSKRLRLFGVNLECQQQPSEYSESSFGTPNPADGSSTWSQGHGQAQAQAQAQAHYRFQYGPKVHHAYFNHHNHMVRYCHIFLFMLHAIFELLDQESRSSHR